MKTPPLALLNSIGFANIAQKILYASALLKAATLNSPSSIVVPAIAGVAGKPEVFAQTAKPARVASLPVLAASNTIGYAFGEIYLNSPAYPIGTAIPAIPAKPASAAVIGVRPVSPVIASPAISSPAIVAIPGYESAIKITATNVMTIKAYLPYATSPALVGSPLVNILEFTPSAVQPIAWLDTLASSTPETISSEPATLEAYLYKYAVEARTIASTSGGGIDLQINEDVFVVGSKPNPCYRIDAVLQIPSWTFGTRSLQLNKVTF